MQTRLADVLPADDARWVELRDPVIAVNFRVRGSGPLERGTNKRYVTWLDHYHGWCHKMGYIPDVARMTDVLAAEWVQYLRMPDPDRATHPDAYAPNSIGQAISAMRYWARRGGLDPMPTFREALAINRKYKAWLFDQGVLDSTQRARIVPNRVR